MKPIQKPNLPSKIASTKGNGIRVSLKVVSDKERKDARIPSYSYILP